MFRRKLQLSSKASTPATVEDSRVTLQAQIAGRRTSGNGRPTNLVLGESGSTAPLPITHISHTSNARDSQQRASQADKHGADANGAYAEQEMHPVPCDKSSKRRATVATANVASSKHGHKNNYPSGASRGFPVPPMSSGVASHDSCTSLKDQFLRIKERFSGNSSSTKSSTKAPSATSSSSGASDSSNLLSRSKEPQLPCAPPHTEQQRQKVHRQPQLEEELKKLNEDSKRMFPNDPWPHNLERWILEDTCLRGYMTCWTIDVGAQLISVIANIAKRKPSPINPDLSLQWIGRQMWGLTIQLPLTRSGDLSGEHVALAGEIDKAIAETLFSQKGASIPQFNTVSCTDATIIPYLSCNNQVPTLRGDDAVALEESNDHVCQLSTDSEGVHPDDITIELLARSPDQTDVSETPGKVDMVIPPSAVQEKAMERAKASETGFCGESSRNSFDIKCKRRSSSASMGLVEEGNEEEDDSGSVRSEAMKEDSSNRSSNVSCNSSEVSSPPSSTSSKNTGIAWTMLSSTSENESGDPNEDFLDKIAPQKTGWLRKRTGLNTWQLRWFELKGNCLCYFATEKDGIPRGAIVLDGVHVLRGKGTDNLFSFTITASNEKELLQIIKFTSRLTHQSSQSCVLRLVDENEEEAVAWISALNRASFCCHLSLSRHPCGSYAKSRTSKLPSTPFYRLRSTSATSREDLEAKKETCLCLHHYGSVAYLQNTNPLLWEINPKDQAQIRKKALMARTKADYMAILTKFQAAFRRIFLPRPRPISLDQTLRDIIPELFLINNILYGGDTSNNLENIFEVLDCYVKRFACAPEERVRVVSTILQACARTICGGDSYFVVHSLLGNDAMIIRPAEARGMPIEIEISSTNAFLFCIRVSSVFCFHSLEQVEECINEESSQEPLLKVHTSHVQEFDFQSGKSSRWLRIRADGMKNAMASADEERKSLTSDSDYGALLDPLG